MKIAPTQPTSAQRAVLHMAARDGKVVLVTHRQRKIVDGGMQAMRELNWMCSEGWLRQDRVIGSAYDPAGDLRYEYVLTEVGQALLSPSQPADSEAGV